MFNTYTARNKFGGYTHEIIITSEIVIRLTEMDSETINVELIEKRLIRKEKIHFSIINHSTLIDAMIDAFSEILHPKKHTPTIDFNYSRMERMSDEVMDFMYDHKESITKTSIVKFSKRG